MSTFSLLFIAVLGIALLLFLVIVVRLHTHASNAAVVLLLGHEARIHAKRNSAHHLQII